MASAAMGTAFRHLRDLFGAGSVVALEDGPLLARYSRSNDPAAFEALVGRHGPMVLATCRAILRNEHDVEDAFQATFLVLARKAGSVRSGESLGPWLHRVAYRASVQASLEARRRRRMEIEAALARSIPSRAEADQLARLHEEIDRLPRSLRLALVLCDLEGLTYEEAAQQLGWTVPSVHHRLAEARARLKGRLARKVGTPLMVMVAKSATSLVPPALVKATVVAATGGSASAGALIVTQIVLRGMLLTKIKIAGTALLASLALAGAGVIAEAARRQEGPIVDDKPIPAATQKPEPAQGGDLVQVLDPEGKPAEGAKVYRSNIRFNGLDRETRPVLLLAQTGPDGSFRLSADDSKAAVDRSGQVLAMSDGYGPAFGDPSVGDGMKRLRLAKDDVPIRGRILDIEGKPVVGASVQVVSILWPASAKLDEWLAALEAEKVAYPVEDQQLRSWAGDDLPSLFPAVKTDREGRFTLRGIGRERVASFLIDGPGIETRVELAATRAMPAVKVPDFDRQNQMETLTYHGASFDLIVGPGLEIVGTVRDKDTGQPLAGVTVQNAAAFGNPLRFLRTTTDAEGRYQLHGLPPRTSFHDEQDVLAVARKDGPAYLPVIQHVGEGRGTITKDFAMKRGVRARGRVTDKATGKPVPASLEYYILADNASLNDYPRYGTVRVGMPFQADDDGRYEIIVMPGRGVLGARFGNETYRLGMGTETIPGLKITNGMADARPHFLVPTNYNTVVGIDPKPGDESVTADIELDRGRTLKGSILGLDGQPLAGAWIMGVEDRFQMWSQQPLPSSEFEVHGLGLEAERSLLFWHKEKGLAGSSVVKPGEEGPISVKLEPCGSLTGRLVDDEGQPRAGVQMTCNRPYRDADPKFEHGSLPDPIKTDLDGRFRASGLVPGLKYTLTAWKGPMRAGDAVKAVILKPGEARDLGDLKIRPLEP